jgi:hypothetical protein
MSIPLCSAEFCLALPGLSLASAAGVTEISSTHNEILRCVLAEEFPAFSQPMRRSLMRKAGVVLFAMLILAQCFGQQAGHTTITVSGCLMNMNGRFKLLTPSQTYVLKGHQNSLFSYNGMLVEVTGTVDAQTKSPSPGIPVVLHITSVKKLADSCQ